MAVHLGTDPLGGLLVEQFELDEGHLGRRPAGAVIEARAPRGQAEQQRPDSSGPASAGGQSASGGGAPDERASHNSSNPATDEKK